MIIDIVIFEPFCTHKGNKNKSIDYWVYFDQIGNRYNMKIPI